MTAAQLLDRCRSLGVELYAAGDRLRYRGRRAALTPDLLAALAATKPEVLAALRASAVDQDLPGHRPPRVLVGDNLPLLGRVRSESIDLIPTDVPFNQKLAYPDYHDRLPRAEYLKGLEVRFAECKRVLRPDGSLFVAISPRHLGRAQCLLEDLGLCWRGTVIWHYSFGPNQRRKFTPSYTPILYFTRHPKRFTFNLDAIRVRSARLQDDDPRAHPEGKTPDDVWVLRPQEAIELGFFGPAGDCWSVARINGTFKRRVGHPCQMPVEVMERVVLAASNPGDWVLDPWLGTGTSLVAAVRHGRRGLGFELSPKTAALAEGRIAEAWSSALAQADLDERAAIQWAENLTPAEAAAAMQRFDLGIPG